MPRNTDLGLPASDKCFNYRKRVTGRHTYKVVKVEGEIKVHLIITCLVLPLWPGCPAKLWPPQPWKCPRPGTESSGQLGGWILVDSEVSSNPNYALIPWAFFPGWIHSKCLSICSLTEQLKLPHLTFLPLPNQTACSSMRSQPCSI